MDAAPPSISTASAAALSTFRQVLFSLGKENCRAVRLGQVDTNFMLEEYGRFRIWAQQTGAALPAEARGSLDGTLRNNSQLRGVVLDILSRLAR